ncbi:phosphomethylpyrimidine synthase ThiC [Eubacterium aggregans]|uniref:Phosphomethylpyrimidine synthase n=1 Tax=Eubacterium aggregans TaxID=81409 RepID=A0A1H4B7H2_9FIRM|nr:phosphomethylpyrimidine synthase ThiC [Eubacterium aggregans]MDD4690624.1 phosphomethylpyrimidine synthase ThiC [Eubacterium aggregans]SEA44205.1 hydroxymethylpyrimidine synthase [Eubacterium aggregans]
MTYTTQMDAARQGIITEEMKRVAEKEGIRTEDLMALMAQGKAIIPCNKNHVALDPAGLGSMLKTKINVNLGTSRDLTDLSMELEKVQSAVDLGAEAIMDLSSYGDTQKFRRMLTKECPAMIGTVPIYDAVVYYHKPLIEITTEEWLDIVRMHAEDGVDFMTIHCGINKETAVKFKRNKRLMNIVSRGGSIIFAWMEMTGKENPFFEHYDEILDICRQYDVTMSLGDACRPGCLQDATDASQIEELMTLGELTKRAWEKDVQVMIEGPGHMPINQIAANMEIQKTLCHGAPFYVLGPLVTDVAPGYDHITSAIGGAIAASNGAAFLCYVTPAEHLRLPDVADVKEGIIAARIAAHSADIAKGIPGAMDWDNAMSAARKKLDWKGMFDLAMDPEKARAYRESSQPEKEDTCSMCGNFCAVKNMNRILEGEIVSIFDE